MKKLKLPIVIVAYVFLFSVLAVMFLYHPKDTEPPHLAKFVPKTDEFDIRDNILIDTDEYEEMTVAQLPEDAQIGDVIQITDGDAAYDCEVGGGNIEHNCIWDGSMWVAFELGKFYDFGWSRIYGDTTQ